MNTFNFLRYEPHCEDTDILGEANKSDHRSVSREKSAGPPRSAPTEAIMQTISPDEHGRDLETNMQLMAAAGEKRDYHSVTREKTVDSPRSPAKEPVVQNISPDDPECDLKTQKQSFTESSERDQDFAIWLKSEDHPRSAPTMPLVQNISPDKLLHLQPMTEAKKRDHRSVSREKSACPPRSAPTETIMQTISPDEHGCNLKTHLQLLSEEATTMTTVSKTMMYGRLKVNTKTGTIKNETTDCLMVFWNKQCLFKIYDDDELLKLAGKEVQQKWTYHKSNGYFKHSVILETSGGKLNCSKIIHVPYDITTIDAAVKAGLMKADSNKMKTVVIPIPHKDSATTDVITSYKGMLAALKELSKSLKVVLSVTFVLEGQIDSTLFNEVFGKKSKIHGNGKVSEANKTSHYPVSMENTMDPPRSIPTKPMVQQSGNDTKTHLQPSTEANKRSYHHVSKESSVDPAASTPTEIMVPELFPKQAGHDPMTQLQLKREGNKRFEHDFNRENSVDLPRSAPRQRMVEKIAPNQPDHDTNTHSQSRTEDKKRFHHHIDRENSMDPPGSIPREPMMQHISLDQLDHDTKTHQSRTEANKRSYHHVSKESSVDPAASTPTEIMVPELFPKQAGHDPMTQLQLKREGNKRFEHDFNRENSVDLPRSAPRQRMVEKIAPNQPDHDTNTHSQSRTEDKKRFHHHIDRENSMDPPGSIPREPMMQHISLDQLDHDTKTHQSRTEANKRSYHHVSKESSVDPAASTPTEIMVPELFPKQAGHDPMTQLQLKREGNKRFEHDFNRENSVDLPRSAPRQRMVEKIAPNQPDHDTNTHSQSRTDVKGLEHGTTPFRVEQLQLQELDFHSPDSLLEKVQNTCPKETLYANLKDISGAEISIKSNRGATTHQMNVVKHHLESRTPDEELCVHSTLINNVSELEFKALQIMENGFRKEEGVHTSLDGDSVVICGSPKLTLSVKKNLTRKLQALRNKQSDEVFLDEEERKIVRAVIEEVQSEDTICVCDEMTSKVVVYSDKHDDIRKFKHKLKIRTGKVKESERSRKRFAENAQFMEPCQKGYTLSPKSADFQDFSGSNNASDVKIFSTKENIRIAVYTADILSLSVDCIVNAANDKMQHGGGVAKVIADAAGSELIWEGKATVREKINRKIPVGCQVTTTAGRLPYKCVIYTVGPCWADYKPHNLQKVKECEKDLYAAIYGCFSEAEKNNISSVALPAVSSGIYAVPQEMCAVQYAKAVLDYSRKSRQGQALTEIHFIDKQPHLVKLMQDTFRTMIENGKVPNYNIQNYVASSSHYQLEQSRDTGQKEHRKKAIPADNSQYETVKLKELSPFYYESKVHHTKQFVFQVSTKPVVCLYKGDILKVKNMDAIVCPDDTKGSGIGTIAIALGTKAKYRDQKEKHFERQKPDLGDVVITDGEENPFNMVVHVVIENNSSQKPGFMSTMKKSIDSIFRKMNEREKVKTIALPLFAVKPELLTEKTWAELFLERFVVFCCEVKNPNLEEVHIITHFASKTAYSTVKKVFIAFADKVNKTQLQEKEPPPRPLPPKDSRTSDHKKDTQSGQGIDSKNGDDGICDSCPICFCPKTDPKALSCGHSFCSECIDEMFEHKPVCPVCGKTVGTLTGDQPKDGSMDVRTSSSHLAGYEKHGNIVITYDFPACEKGNYMGVNMACQLDEIGSNASLQNKEGESAFELMKDLSLKEDGKRVSPSVSQNKMPFPSLWTSMKVTDVIQVLLDPKDTEATVRNEYSMVKQEFDKTMSHAEIVSIKRIQNALLWEHYTLQKKEMEIKAGGVGLANEMQLYHGTKPDAVDLICHSNFDFRMAGERVGALFGQGAYFASNAKYSDCYAVTDDKNHKFMFVAKVLVGKICLGNPDLKKPPYLDDNDKKRGTYNTCVNNVSNPTVYCVFDKNQYYPEYLVEYTL